MAAVTGNDGAATEHAEEPHMDALSSAETSAATEHVGKVPVMEVAFKNGMWWALPQDMSQQLVDKYRAGEVNIGYTWDWGSSRTGSWKHNDGETCINRYMLNFEEGIQRNIDNNRHRTMRIVWVHPSSTRARWTGQIPEEQGFATEQS